jgi:hypothetical protein
MNGRADQTADGNGYSTSFNCPPHCPPPIWHSILINNNSACYQWFQVV